MTLNIVEGGKVIASLPAYKGVVPCAGEYVYHPNNTNVMKVHAVLHRLFGADRKRLDEPVVEVTVG